MSLRGCISKIRESRGDCQLEVNAPYLSSHPGGLCRVTGDGCWSNSQVLSDLRGRHAQPVASDFARLILPATAASSFGNGGQAIEIARGHFEPFFQMRLEIVE